MTSSEKPEPQGSEPSSTDGELPPKNHFFLCTCGHVKLVHKDQQGTCKGVQCNCQGFICDHSQCGWKPREEAPKTVLFEKYEEPKPRPCTCGPDEACGDPCTPAPELKCVCGHAKSSHDSTPCCIGNRNLCGCLIYRPWADAPEPPLTPEEEEEVGPDLKDWNSPEDAAYDQPPPEGPEHTPCVCGHIEPEHDETGECWNDDCDCPAYRTEPDFELPPQPERRAPYVATYSVGGHLYEVAVPGDACLQAVDGALVIRHGLGPVAGLVGFQPLTVEEKA